MAVANRANHTGGAWTRSVGGDTYRLQEFQSIQIIPGGWVQAVGQRSGVTITGWTLEMELKVYLFAFGTYPSTIYLRGKKNGKVKYADREQV